MGEMQADGTGAAVSDNCEANPHIRERLKYLLEYRKRKEGGFGGLPFGSVTSNDQIQPAEFDI